MDRKLKIFLDDAGINYSVIEHGQTYTALETAAAAHVAGREIAKTVIVRLDDQLVMVVVPATHMVDLDELRMKTGAKTATLAEEREFEDLFPDCERGAEPPFGTLYGLRVYSSDALADDTEIAFNAGTHHELVRMSYGDFVRLAKPVVSSISIPRAAVV
jgi:Ala-tRNA(Pro) deacylase